MALVVAQLAASAVTCSQGCSSASSTVSSSGGCGEDKSCRWLIFRTFCTKCDDESLSVCLAFSQFLCGSGTGERPSSESPECYSGRRVPQPFGARLPLNTDGTLRIRTEKKTKMKLNTVWRTAAVCSPCARERRWRHQSRPDSPARTVQFRASRSPCSTRSRSTPQPRLRPPARIHLRKRPHRCILRNLDGSGFLIGVGWRHNRTHGGIAGDTLGGQVAEAAWGLWCFFSAAAPWLASPPYHSHLLEMQKITICNTTFTMVIRHLLRKTSASLILTNNMWNKSKYASPGHR